MQCQPGRLARIARATSLSVVSAGNLILLLEHGMAIILPHQSSFLGWGIHESGVIIRVTPVSNLYVRPVVDCELQIAAAISVCS